MPNVYLVVKGSEAFDITNPDWKRVLEIKVWGPASQAEQKVVDEGRTKHIPIDYVNEMRAAA